ncbi:MAG: peptidoglycan DD-metalloendopeptidase family protein, partial [Gammaproteobacteria bacterium]
TVFGLFQLVSLNNPPSSQEPAPSIALKLPAVDLVTPPDSNGFANNRIPFEPRPLSANASKVSDRAVGWETVVVAPGDSLSLIFGRHGFAKKDLHQILKIGPIAKNLRRIKPGQEIMVHSDDQGHVLGMIQELDYLRSLHVVLENDNYVASVVEIKPEIKNASVLAKIKQSLFLDGQAAGLADGTIMELTDIFGWDIDFVLDVRSGDQFSVVYEEIFKDGEKVKNGRILAAEFVNRGKKLRAVHYSHDDGHVGYYSDSGQAMRKAYLRAPVNFTRISSRFNLRRLHPVYNTIRAHRGVDYAAPHGTPIRATAHGTIVHAGNKGGYGRTVVVKHGASYTTLYAHMSRFARGIKNGVKIKQGQTIGYVGKTGLATGPHLHYEFRVGGVHRNPLKIDLPKASPIDSKYISDFRTKAAPLIAQLDELSNSEGSAKLVVGIDPRFRQLSSSAK